MSWDWEPFESNFRNVFNINTYKERTVAPSLPSLTQLSAAKIISDVSLAEHAKDQVPVTILNDLIATSVKTVRYTSLATLIESWPYNMFKLDPSYIPYFANIKEEDFEVEDKKSCILKCTKLVITLVNKVIKMVKLGQTRIGVLDISGYPVASDYLFSNLRDFKEKTDLCSSELLLITDLYLSDSDCLSINLSETPKYSKCGGLRIKLRNIYFSVSYPLGLGGRYFWEEEYFKTLDKFQHGWSEVFDVSDVRGLELSRLDLRSFFARKGARTDFFNILSDLFRLLHAVDLSYNAINLNGSELATRVLKDFLSSMVFLRRLDLSGNRLTNNLPQILASTVDLEYLNLTGTQLRQVDLSYLARLTRLNHLDISSNSLHNKLNILKNVFVALNQLEVLEMVDCNLAQTHIDDLMPSLEQIKTLKMLNLKENYEISSIKMKCKVFLDVSEEEEYNEDMLE